jgi:hypothetical protein
LGLAQTTDPPFTGTRWRIISLPDLTLDAHAQRHEEGAFLTIVGKGFSPGGTVHFLLLGVPNRPPIPPRTAGSVTVDGSGGFTVESDERFTSTNPDDGFGEVTVVAHDDATNNFETDSVGTTFWVAGPQT